MIEIISFLISIICIPISYYILGKRLSLGGFVILFLSIIYIGKSIKEIYFILLLNQNTDSIVYTLIGVTAVTWISFEKIQHLLKD